MRPFPGFFAITVRETTRARSLRAALLSLLFAVPAYTAFPQAAVQRDSEIRDRLQRAQKALWGNDVGTAEKEFRAILALDPKNAAARTNLGVLAFGRGDCRAASEEFRFALADQPTQT